MNPTKEHNDINNLQRLEWSLSFELVYSKVYKLLKEQDICSTYSLPPTKV